MKVKIEKKIDKSTYVAFKEKTVKNQRYEKYLRLRNKIMVHCSDASYEYKNGDIVEICSCAPFSKRKKWKIKQKI